MTDHAALPNSAAELLLAVYDTIAADTLRVPDFGALGRYRARPILTLKIISDCGQAMRVHASDYDQPDRRFL